MPDSTPKQSSVAETALVSAKEREERKALRRKKREGKLTDLVFDIQESAAKDVNLRRYVFLEDDELRAKGLTRQQIAKVRAWQEPKKSAPYALEASTQILVNKLRGEAEQGKVTINVRNIENIGISLPEKKPETAKPVVIDIVPETK